MRAFGDLPKRCCERCLFLRYSGGAEDDPECAAGQGRVKDSAKETGCPLFDSIDEVTDWPKAYGLLTGVRKPDPKGK